MAAPDRWWHTAGAGQPVARTPRVLACVADCRVPPKMQLSPRWPTAPLAYGTWCSAAFVTRREATRRLLSNARLAWAKWARAHQEAPRKPGFTAPRLATNDRAPLKERWQTSAAWHHTFKWATMVLFNISNAPNAQFRWRFCCRADLGV